MPAIVPPNDDVPESSVHTGFSDVLSRVYSTFFTPLAPSEIPPRIVREFVLYQPFTEGVII